MMTLSPTTKTKQRAKEFFIKASQAQGCGPRTTLKILDALSGQDSSSLYEFLETCSDTFFIELFDLEAHTFVRLSPHHGQNLYNALHDETFYTKFVDDAYRSAITLVTPADGDYPLLLNHINAPPFILSVLGTLPKEENALAIVGSRTAGIYARDVLDSIIPPLIEAQIPIISGGAFGVDTMAHTITLAHKGKTVVVLGSGILNAGPRENKKLFDSIVASGGAIISPFAFHEIGNKGTFPSRNRIIAGMSKGTLVVQAASSSGALITAQYALDEGRSVMAIPGRITDPLSAGCHTLISNGARLITSHNDIIHELGVAHTKNDTTYPLYEKQEKNPLLKLIDNPTTIDDLMVSTGKNFGELQESLFDLHLEGKVVQSAPGVWQRR